MRRRLLAPGLFLALALVLAATAATQAPRDDRTARFGGALRPSLQSAEAAPRPEYAAPPLTVECWAKLESKANFNILIAHASKENAAHWELYTTAGSGTLAAYIPGASPAVLNSEADVCDGRWHHLALVYEADRVRLFADARLVLDSPIRRGDAEGEPGRLWFGAYPPGGIGLDGRLDEVHIRRGAHPIESLPEAAPEAVADTIGLWRFDAPDHGKFPDLSALANAAIEGPGPAAVPEFAEDAPPAYRAADPALKVTLIDRSPDESFIAVRLDTAGRLFVGGREAVFAYEPDEDGGYGERQLLYRFPPHSWIGDIEILGDDLYVATSAAIYRLPGARLKREGIVPEKLAWGTPVDLHVTYHGLAFGPQGDLFFNSGDPLLNYGDFANNPDHWGHWTIFGPEGVEPTPYTGVGGVFRMRPDGRDLRVVAGGLRGSDGVAFDSRYELFTNDNDHESLPDRYTPYRILHVTPGADFAWPRGWTARRSPDRADLLEIANPGLGRGVPVNQAYYGDTYLPEPFRDSLLVAQWGHRAIDSAAIRPRGASYAVEERPLLVGENRARPVGVAVGRGGRVFAAIAYMAQNEGSPTYASDLIMIARTDDKSSHPFDAYEAPTAPADRLWSELSSPDWSRRDPAHREILRRGGMLLVDAVGRLERAGADDPARPHLVWLAGASGLPEAVRLLNDLLRDPDPILRLQIIRALANFPGLDADRQVFVSALADSDARVQLAAIAALTDREGALVDAIAHGSGRGEDTYTRQAAARYLATHASLAELDTLLADPDPAVRLLASIASGMRLTIPNPTAALPDWVPLQYSSPNALFTVDYADGSINLRDLGRMGSFTIAELWAVGHHTEAEDRLFGLLLHALDDSSDRVRLQAAYYLGLLRDPRSEPKVAEATGAVNARRLASSIPAPIAESWLVGPFPADSESRPDAAGPIDLAARYLTPTGERAWRRAADPAGAYPLEPAEGMETYAYVRVQSQSAQTANLIVRSGSAVAAWLNGREVYRNDVDVIPGFRNIARIDLQAGSNDLLIRLRHRSEATNSTIELQALDGVVVELPEPLGIAGLADRLKAAGDAADAVPADFLEIDWTSAASEGDARRGKALFSADGIGCAKCHAVAPGEPGAGAPSLADAGKRFTVSHLVESILAPSAQVAPIFRGTVVATADGRVLGGLITSETAEGIELLMPDATRVRLPAEEVEDRKPMDASTMPAGLVKTPDELRDLLAYLLGEAP